MQPYCFIGGAACHVIRGEENLDQGHKLHEFGQVIHLKDEEVPYLVGSCRLPVLPKETFDAIFGVVTFKPGHPRHAPTMAERDASFSEKYFTALAALAEFRASFAPTAPTQEL